MHQLSLQLGELIRNCPSKEQAFRRLAFGYNDVEETGMPTFRTLARTIQNHYLETLNYFNNRIILSSSGIMHTS